MNISEIKYNCASNGTGVRTVIYVSGCKLHCPGCFNHSTWDFSTGKELNDELTEEIFKSIEPEHISGLSILGGEPLDEQNQESVAKLIKSYRKRFGFSKTIWLWTGYTENTVPVTNHTREILKNIDVLVDGPYIEAEAKGHHPFRGSGNQRILYRGKDF